MREELAKSFYAAYLAQHLGISYQSAYKTYVKEEMVIGELWLALADAAIQGAMGAYELAESHIRV